jgi:hypothetical protein
VSLGSAAKVATSLGQHLRTTGSHLKGNAMKKLFTKAIAHVISNGLLCLLAYASYSGSKSLVSISVAAYWVIMFLGLFIGCLMLVLSVAKDYAKDAETKDKAIGLVGEVTKRKSKLSRTLGWIYLCLIVALLAYSGWVFTAVFYVLVSLIVKLLISFARDNIIDSKSERFA